MLIARLYTFDPRQLTILLCPIQKQVTAFERKIVTLQREVQERTDEIEAVKRKLDQYKDYESVKSELEILKVRSVDVTNTVRACASAH
jgi:predicted RNase H-like nuclease (RuvC/YqgF family)